MNLTDEQIIEGWLKGDPKLTQYYFYGYCQVAYNLLKQRYNLGTPALDFFAIAHELYLSLSLKKWAPLLHKPKELSLRSWVVNGFRFAMLDLMKKERPCGEVDLDSVAELAADDSSAVREELQELNDSYYGNDQLAHLIFERMFIEGYSGVEVAEQCHISPSAVSQRYRKMLKRVVTPYFLNECSVAPMSSASSVKASSPDWGLLRRRGNSRRVSADWITDLRPYEVFVFGSNTWGYHDGGAAALAMERFGAQLGIGSGLQGQSYAIPTMPGGINRLTEQVMTFFEFANVHQGLRFLVTPIGCGCAGFQPEEVAPLFLEAMHLDNIVLPDAFSNLLM